MVTTNIYYFPVAYRYTLAFGFVNYICEHILVIVMKFEVMK